MPLYKTTIVYTTLLIFILVWSTACQSTETPTPTPEALIDPARVGVNFWDDVMDDTNSNKQLFVPGKGGFVLLQAGEDNNKIPQVEAAGLTPIFRYDYTPPEEGASPVAVPTDCGDLVADACEAWKRQFVEFIARVNGANEDEVTSDDPIGAVFDRTQTFKNTLFIVGNEPWLDGGIPLETYAAAYATLWQAVHTPEGQVPENPRFSALTLLVAGQNFHAWGNHPNIRDPYPTVNGEYILNTVTWPRLVTEKIEENDANVDGYALHTYGFGQDDPEVDLNLVDISQCEMSLDPGQRCEVKADWPKDDSFMNYDDQLKELAQLIGEEELKNKVVYITEFNTAAGGNDPEHFPSKNYPVDWIIKATNVIGQDPRVDGILWFVGTPHNGWENYALTEETGQLPCARQDFQYVTGVSNSRCADEAQIPTGFVNLLWSSNNCVATPDRTFVQGYDGESGLDRVTVVAGPAQTYDLSWTEPGLVYAATFNSVPPPGETAIFTLYDRAGNMTQQKVTNPGPIQIPGCDHPDDNFSVASATSPPGEWLPLPAGSRTTPQVAVLNTGFAGNLVQMLFDLGELAALVEYNFDPAVAARKYPVLLIPSGGLYGLENSVIFRQRLELYAEAGGTIVAFAQQHGYEFSVLPGAAGEQGSGGAGEILPSLSGYGWQEDNSCFEASLLLTTNHPSLSGFSQTALTAHVDGYFSTVPTNTTTLLTRNQNGAPGTILYPYGEGRVIATTMYDDWGAANGQLSTDAQTFLRDLISWAVEPTDIPTYGPGAAVSLSASVTNNTENEAVAVRLSLINPAREIVGTQIVTTTLTPGASTNLTFDASPLLPSPSAPLLGIWRLDATLLSERGLPIGPRVPVNRFAIANPPQTTAANRPFDLNITAASDRFPQGSRGEFTFHLTNRTGEARTVTVRYGLPHHTWEVGTDPNTGAGYGLFYGLSQEVTIPAQSEATFVYSPTLYTTDRLWARLDEGDQVQTYAHFAVFPLPPDMIRVSDLGTDAGGYARGNLVEVRATLTNNYGYRFEQPIARLTVTDAEETELYQADVPLGSLVSGAATQFQTTFTLSPTAHSGVAKVNLEVGQRDNNNFYRYGSARATFRVSSSPLGSYFPADLALTPTLSQTVSLNLTNLNPFLDVTSGQVRLQLLEGSTPLAGSITQTFSLAANQSLSLPLNLAVPALEFNGDYRLGVTLEDEYDTQVWQTARLPLTFSAQTTLNQPAHQVRETAAVTLTLRNPGPFVQVLTLTLAAPSLAFEETRPVTLGARQVLDQVYAVPIPTDAQPRLYAFNVRGELPNTSQLDLEEVGAVYIPDSKLQATVSGQPTAPGETLTVEVANIGGVDTLAAYNLSLYDNRGFAVTTVTGSDAGVLVDQPLSIPLTIPDQFRSGPYNLAGFVTDQSTGQRVSVYQALNLSGLTDQLATFTDAETYLRSCPEITS